MKISNSKKELARIISENGGWRDGEFAAQDGDGGVGGYGVKPEWDSLAKYWWREASEQWFLANKIKNHHQTVLSRAEYFHLYPEPDADGWIEWNGGECPVEVGAIVDVKYANNIINYGVSALTNSAHERHVFGTCGSMTAANWETGLPMSGITAYRLHKPEQAETNPAERDEQVWTNPPSIEQLAADYRNAKDYAERKQQEADEAKADADEKLAELVAAGKVQGLVLSVAEFEPEPELVITDWRDLRAGDEVEYVEGSQTWSIGMVGVVQRTDDDEGGDMNVRLLFGEKGSGWPRNGASSAAHNNKVIA